MFGRASAIWFMRIAAIFAAVGAVQPAWGLIISTDQPLSDTASSAGFPYWTNVGWRGTRTGSNSDGSCVYLGDSWVLTANHVGTGNVILDGVSYAPIDGTSQRIGSADARVFRIANPSADLQPVTIFDGTLTPGMEVRMFGTGLDQLPNKTYWRVTSSSGQTQWDEVSNHYLANASGYYWTSAPAERVKRWGTNEISDAYLQSGNYYFQTSFDEGDTTYEANGADKDSGGPVFINNGGSWELIGITVGLTAWAGQPDAAVDWVSWSGTSGNSTIMVDLTQYRDLIGSDTPEPEPILGDLNFDDFVDQVDLDIVLDSWGDSVAPGDPADANGDGFVGQGDLDVVLDNWGNGTPPPGQPLPEPGSLSILALAAGLIIKRRR